MGIFEGQKQVQILDTYTLLNNCKNIHFFSERDWDNVFKNFLSFSNMHWMHISSAWYCQAGKYRFYIMSNDGCHLPAKSDICTSKSSCLFHFHSHFMMQIKCAFWSDNVVPWLFHHIALGMYMSKGWEIGEGW